MLTVIEFIQTVVLRLSWPLISLIFYENVATVKKKLIKHLATCKIYKGRMETMAVWKWLKIMLIALYYTLYYSGYCLRSSIVFGLECTGSDTQLCKPWGAKQDIGLHRRSTENFLSRQWFRPRHNKSLFFLS